MIALTEQDVRLALDKIRGGLCKYCWIQANVQSRDVSLDKAFQTKFNSFYRVRRDVHWRDGYYRLMQASKKDGIAFYKALNELRELSGQIEASFASKLVATLDPARPVIDKFVLHNFGLRLPYSYLYDKLCRSYDDLMTSSVGAMICNRFRERYPLVEITDLKKIDLVLWQEGPESLMTKAMPPEQMCSLR